MLALEEISQLDSQTQAPAATPSAVVALIQSRFGTDVCSIYLLTPDRLNLLLLASVGLRPECVGTLQMGLTEGLVGLVAQELKPIAVNDAFQHPRFKYSPEAGEDPYHSFLGLPLFDRGVLQGVIVVQTVESRSYTADDMRMLLTAAGQLGPLVSTVRAVEQHVMPAHDRLWTLARNVWWSWDAETVGIFRDLDPARWRAATSKAHPTRECRWSRSARAMLIPRPRFRMDAMRKPFIGRSRKRSCRCTTTATPMGFRGDGWRG